MSEIDNNIEEIVNNNGKVTPEQFALTATYNILVTNDIMLGQVAAVIYHIKQSGQYKQKIKQETKRLEMLLKKIEKRMLEVVGPRSGFLSDVVQLIQDECQANIDQIIEAITEEFEKIGHPYPLLMGHLETALTFSELAVINLDLRYKEMVERKVPDAKNILWLKQDEIKKSINRLIDLLFQGGVVDLNKNQRCKTSLMLIERKLTDVRLIAKSITESDKLNPAKDL